MPLNHPTIKIPGQPLNAVADWNANHVITGGVLDIGANNFIVDTNVLFVNATTNRVGIGTAAPAVELDVTDTGRVRAGDFYLAATGNIYNAAPTYGIGLSDLKIDGELFNSVQVAGAYGITFATGSAGSEALIMAVTKAGNVGIRTASPSKQLEIGGTGNLLLNGSDSRFIIDGTTIIDNTRALTNIATFRQTESANDNYFLGNVGIGTITPAVSALLDLTSTTGALLLTRMTTAQRNALTAVNGMIIYNSDTNKIEGYENAAWVDI